jgi:hypothetical protein
LYKTFVYIVILSLIACSDDSLDIKTNPRIKEAVDHRMLEFRDQSISRCRKSSIDRAIIYTDSLIAADYFMELTGTIPFPPKPEKPNYEGPVIIKDTIKATPILSK